MSADQAARVAILRLYVGPLFLASNLLGAVQVLYPVAGGWAFHARAWVLRQILLGVLWYDPNARTEVMRVLRELPEPNNDPNDEPPPANSPNQGA